MDQLRGAAQRLRPKVVTPMPVARLPAGVLPQVMAPLSPPVGRPLVGVTGYRLAAVAPATAA